MAANRIGIIGGSGLYHLEGFTKQKWVKIKTPFGAPSDDFLTGELGGREVVFLPRHGRGHRILPTELNHRANIYGMKKLGAQWIISVSAVGSLQAKYKPCDVVLVDQFLDRTKQSLNHTFFGRGIVGHVAFADPICEELRRLLLKNARALKARAHDGGTYVNMEGPAFSTRAESTTNHKLGYDVIGMTNLGEAKCAREAEIAYATLAMITDYDCWKVDEAHVTVEMVIANLTKNAALAKAVVARTISQIPLEPTWPCHSALANAIMTDKKCWPTKTRNDLKLILARYFSKTANYMKAKFISAASFAAALAMTLLATGCGTAKVAAAPVALRVMTYNIQHGAGIDHKVDLQRTADAINHEHPDIVALEEVDKGVERTERRDLTAELAALTSLTGYFSNNFHFQGGEYGNAVLTRFPIVMSTNTHYHMLYPKEQRGIIQLILDVHGHKLLFMTTHIDYRQKNTERLMNVNEIKEIIKQYPGLPMILCGDFNDFPDSQVHTELRKSFDDTFQLVGQGSGLTFPSDTPRQTIDYIWISPDKSVVPLKAWVPDTQASDHRPLVADFQLK